MRQVNGHDPKPSFDAEEFVPAAGHRSLTRFYDAVMRWALREGEIKGRLVGQLGLQPGQRVLDLGCGTGTLLAMMKVACPEAEVHGLDADPEVIAIAQAKADRAGLTVEIRQAMASQLPYADGVFDCVVSSLLLHHLARDGKVAALREANRVLRPGGRFLLADWDQPHHWFMKIACLPVRLLDGFRQTADNVNGLLPELGAQAGFIGWTRSARYSTVLGTLSLFEAAKPVGQQEVTSC